MFIKKICCKDVRFTSKDRFLMRGGVVEMKDSADNAVKNPDVIDVVEDFNYGTQSEKYNTAYKKWRYNKKNPYAFHYVKNMKEKTFIDGKGFVDETPEYAENITLMKISCAVGVAFLIYFFVESIGSELIVWILNLFNVDIAKVAASSEFMGNEWVVLAVNIILSLTKYIIPIGLLTVSFKLPTTVALPIKISDKYEVLGGISISLIIMILSSLVTDSSPILFTNRTFFLSNQILYEDVSFNALFIYYIYEILIASLLSEILIHGLIMHVLRQFGDVFTILVTSVMSMVLVNEFPQCIIYGLLSLLTGVFVLRSGSILTGFIIRLCFNIYFFGLFIIDNGLTYHISLIRAYFMSVVFIFGVFGCAIFINRHSKNMKLVNNETFITNKQKIIAIATTFPMITWLSFSVVFTLIKYFS